MLKIPVEIIERLRAGACVFSADEIAEWPDSLFDELRAANILCAEESARTFACDSCGDDHVEEVQYVQATPTGALRAYIPCPELARVHIPLEKLAQWRIDPTHAALQPSQSPTAQATSAARREWPNPVEHTTAKYWTRKDGTLCISTKTDGVRDGVARFEQNPAGKATLQIQLLLLLCFKSPQPCLLIEAIEQAYPTELATEKRNADSLRTLLKRLRSLVSAIRKKFELARINPDILPPLDVDSSIDMGIQLRVAMLHRLDDHDLDDADLLQI